MRLIRLTHTPWLYLPSLFIVFALLASSQARADQFDDAVNHYLRGFESCKEASGLLRSNQVRKARSKLLEYQRYFKEAQQMDPSIVKTQKRGMEGNILFCQRVEQQLQVEEGTPYMDRAVEHCDLAQKALKEEDPVSARANLEQFKELSDKAFEVAPAMKDIFSITSQVRRCERLQKKVSRISEKVETKKLSIETVKEESSAYLNACLEAEKQLGARAVDDALLKNVNATLRSAISHKKSTRDETLAFEIFEQEPDHPAKPVVEGNLSKGDQCVARVEKEISSKERELANIKAKFDKYADQLVEAGKTCEEAKQKANSQPSDTTYVSARKTFQQAQVINNRVRDALKGDKDYDTYSSWPQVKSIDRQLSNVSSCIDSTNKAIGAMFATLQAEKQAREKAEQEKLAAAQAEARRRAEEEAKRRADEELQARKAAEQASAAAKAAAEAKAKAAAEAAAKAAAAAAAVAAKEEEERKAAAERAKGKVSAAGVDAVNRVKGAITFDGLIADHAVFYVDDGSSAPSSVDIELDKTGFDKDVYVAGDGATIEIRNKDNALHRITATDDYREYSDTLVRIYPRQRKRAQVGWPVNTMVSIRSERGVLTASYIANVKSGTFKHIPFNVGKNTFEFEFKGSGKGTKAYLLMPGYDTVEFDFSQGSEQTKPIIQNKAPVGSVMVSAQ
ncbi:MAG: hypothetical protein R3208_13980 [Ketobacteraceae bacterium]|nr:hypothetical protein [Ketobacteraceae bacterium]